MPIINHAELEWKEQAPGVMRKEWVNHERGGQAITKGEVRMSPGAAIPWHSHEVEDVGTLWSGHQVTLYLGDEEHVVVPGNTMLIPANTRHRLINTGNKEAHIIFCFPTAQVHFQK